MQSLRSNSLKRTVATRMGISFVSGLERIMRVACRPSIPDIMMFMRIRRVFSLMAYSTPSLPRAYIRLFVSTYFVKLIFYRGKAGRTLTMSLTLQSAYMWTVSSAIRWPRVISDTRLRTLRLTLSISLTGKPSRKNLPMNFSSPRVKNWRYSGLSSLK